MSTYIQSELQRIIAVAQENEKISSEYAHKFFSVYLTASEAREILKIIESNKD
jgi:hypothetical protein